jgi:hypothetical protein
LRIEDDTFTYSTADSGTAGASATLSERLRITSAGLVGVGTSSPSQRLHVVGTVQSLSTSTTVADNVGFFAGNGGDGSLLNGITFQGSYISNLYLGRSASADDLVVRNGSAELVRVTNAGNVGIGTTSPGELLSVYGNVAILSSNRIKTTDSGGNLTIQGGGTFPGGHIILNGGNGSDNIIFNRSGASASTVETARIDSSGRLLVGTSSSSDFARLVLQGYSADATGASILAMKRGSAAATLTSAGYDLGVLDFMSSDSGLGARIKAVVDGAWSSTSDCPTRLEFSTTADGASSPTERMRIDSSPEELLDPLVDWKLLSGLLILLVHLAML